MLHLKFDPGLDREEVRVVVSPTTPVDDDEADNDERSEDVEFFRVDVVVREDVANPPSTKLLLLPRPLRPCDDVVVEGKFRVPMRSVLAEAATVASFRLALLVLFVAD